MSDRREERRPGRRASRSPEPRRRRSAERGGRDRGGSAGDSKRPRVTGFDSGGAAAATAMPQQTPAQIGLAFLHSVLPRNPICVERLRARIVVSGAGTS